MTVTALLLAAGASSRMRGRDKMLEPVRGQPLLRDRAQACLDSGATNLRVVLPTDTPERARALDGLKVEICLTRSAEQSLSHSIRTGMKGLDSDAVLLVLADLPDLTAAHMARVIAAAKAHPLKSVFRGATDAGKPGHPVLIRKSLYEELNQLHGDAGAQDVLKRHAADTVLVPLGPAALADLDTPEAWEAWRASQ